MTRREELAQAREHNAAWGAETPGGPPLSSAERGLLVFQAGYDRRFLVGLVDELAAALGESVALQPKVLAVIERQGYVFDGWPPEHIPATGWNPATLAALDPGVRWQGLAFTLYTEICQISGMAERTLSDLGPDVA